MPVHAGSRALKTPAVARGTSGHMPGPRNRLLKGLSAREGVTNSQQVWPPFVPDQLARVHCA